MIILGVPGIDSEDPGREHSTKFIRGGSDPISNPLPFHIPFLTEKVPLSYTFH